MKTTSESNPRNLSQWTPRAFPRKIQTRGRYCSLAPLSAAKHASALHRAFAEDRENHDWKHLPYGPFSGEKEFAEWLREITARRDPQFYAVLDGEGIVSGMASYLNIVPAHGVLEVGHIHYAPRMQQTPAATEAMYLMMRRAFDDLHYRRYEWKCDSRNARSRAAALRFGFKFEGVFRQHQVNKNRSRDSAWFSVIDKEWRGAKRAFERWLSPANFTPAGKQKQSLRALMPRK